MNINSRSIYNGNNKSNNCTVIIVSIFLFIGLCSGLIYIIYRLTSSVDCSKILSCNKDTPCINMERNTCMPYNEGTEICSDDHEMCDISNFMTPTITPTITPIITITPKITPKITPIITITPKITPTITVANMVIPNEEEEDTDEEEEDTDEEEEDTDEE